MARFRPFGQLLVLLMICSVTGPGLSAEQDFFLMEPQSQGTINWSLRLIHARGTASPLEPASPSDVNKQERLVDTARIRACENLMAIILTMPLDSRHRASVLVFSQSDIMNPLQAMVNQARVIQKDYLTDGSVELAIALSFDGGFSQLLLPEEIKQIQRLKMSRPQPSATPLTKKEMDAEAPPTYTGLIVDTRGLTIRPALSFRVIDEGGLEVYGPAYISREYAVQHGTAFYTRSLQDPALIQRTGASPLIVTGLKSQGDLQADVIISRADAAKLHSSPAHLHFLNQGQVAMVIERVPPRQQ